MKKARKQPPQQVNNLLSVFLSFEKNCRSIIFIDFADVAMYLSSPYEDEKATAFNVKHPFVYFIWDKRTSVPIFSGRIVKLPKYVPPTYSDNFFDEYDDEYDDEDFMD